LVHKLFRKLACINIFAIFQWLARERPLVEPFKGKSIDFLVQPSLEGAL